MSEEYSSDSSEGLSEGESQNAFDEDEAKSGDTSKTKSQGMPMGSSTDQVLSIVQEPRKRMTANMLLNQIGNPIVKGYTSRNLADVKEALKVTEISSWDLIQLDAAVAIATGDQKEYRKIQKHLQIQLALDDHEKPASLLLIASEDMKSLNSKVGSQMRRLMSQALQTAILYKDFDATEKLFSYTQSNKLIMHVFLVNLQFLLDQRQYNIVSLLIFH